MIGQKPRTRRIAIETSGEIYWVPKFNGPDDSSEPSRPFRRGERVRFMLNGHAVAATVDDCTTDGSIVWAWIDGGLGRKLLCGDEETIEHIS